MSGATAKRDRSHSQGWKAWSKRNARWLKPLFAVLVLGLAAFLLYRTLSHYETEELVASVIAIPLVQLGWAFLFAAASYGCLTGFDYLALRYAGHPLAYRRAALASFVSLSLGHNIGFAALSSGTIRYRFYSRWGLDAEAVGKLILFCGATVGLGLATLGGLALILRPGLAAEIIGIGRPAVLSLGALSLAAPLAYLALAAFLRRPLVIRNWSFGMPGLGLAAAQILVGTANFACVAACLHQVLSAVEDLPYLSVAAVYVIAILASLVTHVPGGLGVIESVVVHLLPGERLIGAVLVFRFVYFLVPLALGSVIFMASEILLRGARGASAKTSGVEKASAKDAPGRSASSRAPA